MRAPWLSSFLLVESFQPKLYQERELALLPTLKGRFFCFPKPSLAGDPGGSSTIDCHMSQCHNVISRIIIVENVELLKVQVQNNLVLTIKMEMAPTPTYISSDCKSRGKRRWNKLRPCSHIYCSITCGQEVARRWKQTILKGPASARGLSEKVCSFPPSFCS